MLNTFRYLLYGVAITLIFISQEVVNAGVDKALEEQGWAELVFDDKPANHFSMNDHRGIDVVSKGSVSLLKMPVKVDISTKSALHWRWCLAEGAPATPLSIKGADDRSLAIYVAFPFVAEEATAFERMERRIVEATIGKDAPGRVLMYVWGGEAKRGTLVDSPYLGKSGMMKILRPADTPSNRWFQESINIAEDYREFFGNPPPNTLYIGISADTDDTQSTSRGIIMDLKFRDPAKVL